jgi:hypothetical protein
MRFRTQSGSAYRLEGSTLIRLSEVPVLGDSEARALRPMVIAYHTPIIEGRSVRFELPDGSWIRTSPVKEVTPA